MDTITVRIDQDTLRELDALLEARRRKGDRRSSRSHVVRALIRQAYILAEAKGEVG